MPVHTAEAPISTAVVQTPVGSVRVEWGPLGLRGIHLGETGPVSKQRPREFEEFIAQLKEYFAGKRVAFRVQLDLEGVPDFYARVLKACSEIPYGQTRTYGDLAHEVGNPKAARAVGQAMRNNPIPLVIPCHRVVASGGGLGGFGGGTHVGLEWKKFLLALEGAEMRAA